MKNVRINGLLNYNVEQTDGKIRKPELEITKVAINEKGQIVGGIAGDPGQCEIVCIKEATLIKRRLPFIIS